MNKNIIFMIILAILVLVAAVQAVQLTTLKSKVEAGALKVGGSKGATPQTGGTSGGNSINNLPTMVGGC